MRTVNILEAKSILSALLDAIESGAETEIVITRNGLPAARLVPLVAADISKRIGVAKRRVRPLKARATLDATVAKLMRGG